MMYTLDLSIGKFRCVCFFFNRKKWSIKYGSYCIVATAQMKFASEARPSQYIGPFGNTEPTCMPLSGHFMDIEGRVLVYQTERYQLIPFGNTEPTCMPLSGHFMDIEGRVLVYQTERYQLSPTYNASW